VGRLYHSPAAHILLPHLPREFSECKIKLEARGRSSVCLLPSARICQHSPRITGIRAWMGAVTAFGVFVRIDQVSI
jgi:hypothetical protein